MLPKKLRAHIGGIINLDKSDGGGTHWVAYYNKPGSDVVYYDPFGMDIDPYILKYLKSTNKRVMVLTSQIQDRISKSCGYFAMHFLFSMNNGVSVSKFLSQFDQDDQLKNQRILEKFYNIV